MFKLNRENKSVKKLKKVSYKDLECKERNDIQEWVAAYPTLLSHDHETEELLIIAKEHVLPSMSNIRLDLLAIDKEGNLVIIELKRDNSGKNVCLQAIKYAAYCSAFKINDIYKIYEQYLLQQKENYNNDNNNDNHNADSHKSAKERILNFITCTEDDLNNKQRIILVAKEFQSDVIASVLWLREYYIDISCIKLEPLFDEDTQEIFIDSNIIIPLPEAQDYIKGKENKEQEKAVMRGEKTFTMEQLKLKIRNDFTRSSDQTPRFIIFCKILLEQSEPISREKIKEIFFTQYNIGNNIGHAGRLLSNISQYITNGNNTHLIQMITFESDGDAGSEKNNYYLLDEYRELVKKELDLLDKSQE